MKYSFDTPILRKGTYSYKWDSPDSGQPDYPLWVADMDFATAPCVIQALHRRVDHGVFGYVTQPEDYRQAVRQWFGNRHGWDIMPQRVVAAPGIVPALTALLRHYREAGKGRVLIQTPAYNAFFSAAHRAGCHLMETALVPRERHYEMDWEDMKEKLKETDIFVLCNPHNPTGRVWTEEELRRINALCHQHGVMVIADEIHAEFVFSGSRYIPYATVAEDPSYIVMTSAGKAFNIAGLQLATLVPGNDELLESVWEAMENGCLEDINCMGLTATIAAYREGEEWLEEMVRYIEGNYQQLCTFFATHVPMAGVTRMEGTYLAWVDMREVCGEDTEGWCRETQQKTGVKFNPGEMYGKAGYIRINMACPRAFLLEALTRALA